MIKIDLDCVLYPSKLLCFGHFVCFYGTALWKKYNVGTLARLISGYIKCMKLFFGYSKYYSVTSMFLELGRPSSFDTLIFNSSVSLSHQCQVTQIAFIAQICQLCSV